VPDRVDDLYHSSLMDENDSLLTNDQHQMNINSLNETQTQSVYESRSLSQRRDKMAQPHIREYRGDFSKKGENKKRKKDYDKKKLDKIFVANRMHTL